MRRRARTDSPSTVDVGGADLTLVCTKTTASITRHERTTDSGGACAPNTMASGYGRRIACDDQSHGIDTPRPHCGARSSPWRAPWSAERNDYLSERSTRPVHKSASPLNGVTPARASPYAARSGRQAASAFRTVAQPISCGEKRDSPTPHNSRRRISSIDALFGCSSWVAWSRVHGAHRTCRLPNALRAPCWANGAITFVLRMQSVHGARGIIDGLVTTRES